MGVFYKAVTVHMYKASQSVLAASQCGDGPLERYRLWFSVLIIHGQLACSVGHLHVVGADLRLRDRIGTEAGDGETRMGCTYCTDSESS